jgi:hypothetical protein
MGAPLCLPVEQFAHQEPLPVNQTEYFYGFVGVCLN